MEKTLVDMEPVKCARLEKTGGARGDQIVIEALVQGFSDGSTRILCDELQDGKCMKKEDKPCIFEAKPVEN